MYDYVFKCIIVGDKGVGQTTLVKYLEQQTLEATKKRLEATKKGYDKKIDEYRILRDKTTGEASKRVLIKWIKSLIKQKTALEEWTPEKALAHNFLFDIQGFKDDAKMTIGVDFCFKIVKLRGNNAKLQIWVLSPLERFNSIHRFYVRDSLGAIILYDITNINTLNRISEWSQLIREKNGNIPILLVGNKIDLEDLREISIDQINKIIEELQLSAFMEISSKTGENVELMFERFTQLIINFFENRS